VPAIYISFDAAETSTFKSFVEGTNSAFSVLKDKPNHWHFVDVALGNFIKAFFTPDRLNQMLWHTVTLEALLGEKGESMTKRLAKRIASILGSTNDERKEIEKQFEELYDFRSELVHGSQPEKDLYEGHLRKARALARRVLYWFINYLAHIRTLLPTGSFNEKVPERKDMLMLLDLDQNSRTRLAWLLANMPAGFPQVREWQSK